MRQVSRSASYVAALLAAGTPSQAALAEEVYYLNQSQSGFNLPGVSLPQGQDEVRASDGTTCRSAVGGSGAYLDVGSIRGNNRSDPEMASYGRVVIPLGGGGKRLDCSKLYALEVERLQMELKLMKMGLNGDGAAKPPAQGTGNWAQEGWSEGGPGASEPTVRR